MASFFKRLLRKQDSPTAASTKSEINPVPVQPLAGLASSLPSAEPQAKPHLDNPQLIVGVAQSIGIQRDNNEDSLFTLTTNLLVDDRAVNFGLYIVADGMGGHDNGELASRMAVDILASHVITTFCLELISSKTNNAQLSVHEVLSEGIQKAHQAIKKETEGGGTTVTAALILGDQLTLCHVGDSRAYFIDPLGALKLLTRDHSLVKRLEEIGQISAEQALTHPQRNVLYRALGQGEPFEPDISSMQVCPGCQLVICSDGLWGVIPEEVLSATLNSPAEPQYNCQSLVESANQLGGPDNISVIIVRLPG